MAGMVRRRRRPYAVVEPPIRHDAMKLAPLALLLVTFPIAGCGSSESPLHDVSSDVDACKENMRRIYDGLEELAGEGRVLPDAPGAQLFATLVSEGVFPADAEHARILTCPGPGVGARAIDEVPEADRFADAALVTDLTSAYTVRDFEAHPLARFPSNGREPILCCDNHQGMNHDGVMNVLMADGSVVLIELAEEQAAGNLPEDATTIPVGPGSPIESLAMMRAKGGS